MRTIHQGHLPVRTLVLIGMVILITAQAYAQNANARLTITLRNATLKEFVKLIENSTGYSFIYHMVEHRVKKDIIFFAPDCKNTCQNELESFMVPSFENYRLHFKAEINREIIESKYRRSLILNNTDYYFAEECFKGEAHDKFELFHVLTSYRDKQFQKENKEIKDEE